MKILRFRKSERLIHWALAIPFLVCYCSALVLVVFYNPAPDRPYRDIFSWIHRVSGICLTVLPPLAVLRCSGDWKIHFSNIKQAWMWTIDDIKWLSLMGLAFINPRVRLPKQGKFNAGEKINFMMLMGTYPLYLLTGALIWLTGGALLAWLVHIAMAIVATPLIFGHIFMATVNPETRAGLSGMITGFVDRQWAKHHHAKWYEEEIESGSPNPTEAPEEESAPLGVPGAADIPTLFAMYVAAQSDSEDADSEEASEDSSDRLIIPRNP